MTRAAVPKIIGNTPALATSNITLSFPVPVVTKRHEIPDHPLISMCKSITARIARMSQVAAPVRPVKNFEPMLGRVE